MQGLFYFEKGVRLPKSHEAIAFADPIADSNEPDSLVRVVSFMLQQPEKLIGNGVFSYRFYSDENDPNRSASLMVFYESMLFLGMTLPVEG